MPTEDDWLWDLRHAGFNLSRGSQTDAGRFHLFKQVRRAEQIPMTRKYFLGNDGCFLARYAASPDGPG